MNPRLRTALLLISALVVANDRALGQDAGLDEGPRFTIRSSLKNSVLLSRLPDDPLLFPDRDAATGFWRFRLEPAVRLNQNVRVEAAFEQRVRVASSRTGEGGSGVLPSEGTAPFRLRQLDWEFASSSRAEWRGEIDRAAIQAVAGVATITLGRQAIGWGRGVLFSAVDLFSPFTPLEADREWRRGVDAVRADIKLAGRTSVDGVAAFGDQFDRSAFALRLRGYAGTADLELIGGRRARDSFGAVTMSAAVREAEVHGELALFRTPRVPGSLAFDTDRSVVKAVVGASYRFALGNGLLMYGEYHYSGFGATSANGIVPLLTDPGFQERYLRGDTQILGRHALAVVTSYEWSPEIAVSANWLQSPTDASGVMVPTVTWTMSDNWSVIASGYVPFGGTPTGLTMGSQFGASPLGLFVQLRAYR